MKVRLKESCVTQAVLIEILQDRIMIMATWERCHGLGKVSASESPGGDSGLLRNYIDNGKTLHSALCLQLHCVK